MTNEELIAKAREQMEQFEGATPDMPPLSLFSNARQRDAVVIYFTRPGADDRFEICLDRNTGDLIGASYMPQTPPRK